MTDLVIENLRSERLARTRYLHADESIVLRGGEIIGLTGPSGTGKTLLFRAIADLDPAVGKFLLDSTSRESMPGHEWRKRVCYLPAESAWWHDTVGEHFETEPSAEDLRTMGFSADVMIWRIADLSTGERQRLALLRSLQGSPDVLLLDEPTASMDQNRTRDAEKLVQSYASDRQIAVFWISHDREQLDRIAAKIYGIDAEGQVAVMNA